MSRGAWPWPASLDALMAPFVRNVGAEEMLVVSVELKDVAA
jgi:hypothetical protein